MTDPIRRPAGDSPVLDRALALLDGRGPDLANGMTSHVPMVAEALCALGRPDAVLPWVERNLPGILPWPAPRERIARDDWRAALGRPERLGDWRVLFRAELDDGDWRAVLDRWVLRLAPGLCAAACHGWIRVGHAARALAATDTAARRRELGDALASWAYAYQELPAQRTGGRGLAPRDAIARVPLVPTPERHYAGTIVSSLEALSGFPAFAPVIDLLDVDGDLAARGGELADVFARVYLGSARDPLGTIVFTHGVTSVHAFANLLPLLREETAREALRFAWQAACGLYAAFGRGVAAEAEIAVPADAASLAERAVAHGDDHAIKLTEACLARNAEAPSPALLAAAHHAIGMLAPAPAGSAARP